MDSTVTNPPSWGDKLLGIFSQGLDTAAAYGAAKLQADATVKAAQASAIRSEDTASKTASAGTQTMTMAGAPSRLPAWVMPAGIAVGAVVVLGLVWKLVRK
jgi:hypothetical protein